MDSTWKRGFCNGQSRSLRIAFVPVVIFIVLSGNETDRASE
jgi:hypothetical protein